MKLTRLFALAPLAVAAACGGVNEKDPCLAANPDEALDCLGVATDDGDRVDTLGVALPEDYSPLGPTAEIGVSRELFVAGLQIAPPVPAGEPVLLDSRAVTIALADDETREINPAVLDAVDPGAPWESDTTSAHPSGSPNAGGKSTRAATAADLDGDGVDEIVVVYLDTDDSANEGVVFADIAGVGAPVIVATVPGVEDLAITRIDSDGDGADELALAASGDQTVTVMLLAGDLAGVVETASFDTVVGDAAVSAELAAGNLDRDNGDELVVVINEFSSDAGEHSSVSRYRIFDDLGAGFVERVGATPIRVESGGSFEAEVADVTIGDIDADGRGEIVFAGLGELTGDSCAPVQHLYLALDDLGDSETPMATIGALAEDQRYLPPGCSEVSSELPVWHVFVNAMDIDGDGVDEIQANTRIFSDFRMEPFAERFAIDQDVLADGGLGGSALSVATTAIETADINGNGRSEIIVYGQHTDRIAVWGLDGPNLGNAVFREMLSIDAEVANSQTRLFPIIAVANVDSDGAILKYSAAEYRLVFTEPVIVAAIAAAPCAEGIGQNIEACTTAYGTSETTSGGVDGSVSVSAKTFVSFEAKDPFFGLGVEGQTSVTATASFSAARSYSTTESIEYTTGALEDTVVFTTVPLDRYTYTIAAHPDPELVGTEVVINLPRAPITVQVEREFYNQSVVPGSPLVDESVFAHAPGDIDSYPTEADADVLVSEAGLKSSRPITVGEGAGQTSTEIEFSESTEYRAGAEIAYETELAVTGGGVGVGVGVGASVGAGLSWGASSSTIYRGTIGSIDAERFADNIYTTGLFTYIHNFGDPTAPQFEVVSYWVRRSERN